MPKAEEKRKERDVEIGGERIMSKENESCGLNSHKDKHDIQDAEIRETLKHIKNKILVMSGKGGVGKSSVAAYLSVTLAKMGYRVGLMDVDLHGPSIPRLLGLRGTPQPSFHPGKVCSPRELFFLLQA